MGVVINTLLIVLAITSVIGVIVDVAIVAIVPKVIIALEVIVVAIDIAEGLSAVVTFILAEIPNTFFLQSAFLIDGIIHLMVIGLL